MVKMSTVWDRTAEFLTDNLGAILPIALLAYLVPFSITGSFEPIRINAETQLAVTLQLVSLAFSILAVWGSLTIIAMTLGTDASAAGAVGARRLVPALVVALVVVVAMIALLAPVLLLLLAAGTDLMALSRGDLNQITPASAGIVALYSLVAFPVLVWLTARLVLLNPLIVAEKRMLDAIPRSWNLTRGLTMRVIGVTLLYFLVSGVAVLATQMVFGSIFRLVAGPAEGLSLSGVLTSVMVAAVQTGFTVIVPVFTANLYRAIVAQRESAPAT